MKLSVAILTFGLWICASFAFISWQTSTENKGPVAILNTQKNPDFITIEELNAAESVEVVSNGVDTIVVTAFELTIQQSDNHMHSLGKRKGNNLPEYAKDYLNHLSTARRVLLEQLKGKNTKGEEVYIPARQLDIKM